MWPPLPRGTCTPGYGMRTLVFTHCRVYSTSGAPSSGGIHSLPLVLTANLGSVVSPLLALSFCPLSPSAFSFPAFFPRYFLSFRRISSSLFSLLPFSLYHPILFPRSPFPLLAHPLSSSPLFPSYGPFCSTVVFPALTPPPPSPVSSVRGESKRPQPQPHGNSGQSQSESIS